MAILPIAAKMQEVGIRIDAEKCRSENERLMKEAESLSNSFHGWLRRKFNLTERFDFGSSPQTADLMIDKLGILREVRTPKGNRSTSKKIFEGMRDTNPAVNAIYTYREMIKSATGFYNLYPQFKGPDGRIHPNLLTCHVLSGEQLQPTRIASRFQKKAPGSLSILIIHLPIFVRTAQSEAARPVPRHKRKR